MENDDEEDDRDHDHDPTKLLKMIKQGFDDDDDNQSFFWVHTKALTWN
jgi:hypothetical protein